MPTFKLTLAYDGTNYAGWQSQRGQVTLQDTLEGVLAKLTGQTIRVTASGRTDAGVHALGQVISFRSDWPSGAAVLQKALNAELPHDMAVLAADFADDDFHAIRSAKRKRYRYVICDTPIRDVFARHYAWHIYTPLDDAAMHRAASDLAGRHDFRSFETTGSERETSVRTVFDIAVTRTSAAGQGGAASFPAMLPCNSPAASEPHSATRIVLEIEADGFLYNMVRAIVGTLVEVGQGRRAESWPGEVLAACDRRAAGRTAPPQGLFLVRVDY
jgi:tRNA pseudouridine38-40 synthase